MTRGGKREGAGRPATGIQTTKATIYKKDRELLNNYAREVGVSVNEYIHRVIRHPNFKGLHYKIIMEKVREKEFKYKYKY